MSSQCVWLGTLQFKRKLCKNQNVEKFNKIKKNLCTLVIVVAFFLTKHILVAISLVTFPFPTTECVHKKSSTNTHTQFYRYMNNYSPVSLKKCEKCGSLEENYTVCLCFLAVVINHCGLTTIVMTNLFLFI